MRALLLLKIQAMRGVFLIIIAMTLAACGSSTRGPLSPSAPSRPTPATPGPGPSLDVPAKPTTDGIADSIELTCSGPCPPQVGVLVFTRGLQLKRCTGTLIAPDQVLSSGHCDFTGEGQGHFILQGQGPGRAYAIKNVGFKALTINPKDPDRDAHRPDAAVFTLAQRVRNVPIARLARGNQLQFTSLHAYVVNETATAGKMKIDRLDCQVRHHGAQFPFHISEAPDVLKVYGCRADFGHSGSAMFAPGSDEIQAILGAGTTLEEHAEYVKTNHARDLWPYERHSYAIATNARCLGIDGQVQRCLKADTDEIARRWREIQLQAQASVGQRGVGNADSYLTRFQTFAYELAGDRRRTPDRRYEIFYNPTCRTTSSPLERVVIPMELVLLTYGTWAEPEIQVAEQRVAEAKVLRARGDRYRLAVQWPQRFAPLYRGPGEDDPERQHARTVYGREFSIDLPECAR